MNRIQEARREIIGRKAEIDCEIVPTIITTITLLQITTMIPKRGQEMRAIIIVMEREKWCI